MKQSDWLDISVGVHPDMLVWPGSPRPDFQIRKSMDRGDKANETNVAFNVHAGTHIDAPWHFFKDGQRSDQLPLADYMGIAHVIDLSDHSQIELSDVQARWPSGQVERVLFKTTNSTTWSEKTPTFRESFCAPDVALAEWLCQQKIRLIGIDYLSIDRWKQAPAVHRILIQGGIRIVEGLDLSPVESGRYELICLPMKFVGLDGAPARAVVRKVTA